MLARSGKVFLRMAMAAETLAGWLGILILHDFCKRLDCIRREFLAQSAHLRVTLWTTTWIAAYSFWKWSSFTWHSWLFLSVVSDFCKHNCGARVRASSG